MLQHYIKGIDAASVAGVGHRLAGAHWVVLFADGHHRCCRCSWRCWTRQLAVDEISCV